MLPKFMRIAAIAAAALVVTAGAALAETAYTKGSTNVRGGPGTSYPILFKLTANTKVEVEGCTPTDWCVITKGNKEGFVARSLLKKTQGGLPFDFNIIIGNDQINIGLGGDSEEPDDEDVPEVCFYQGEDLSGANFCVEPGDSDDDIPGSFDNNIESILITGGAFVTVCTGSDFTGVCREYDETMDALPSSVRNKITSYEADE
ncbi:MAG: SH3 domain-containing protein [Devosia sp.]